jgi:hypothetical protein
MPDSNIQFGCISLHPSPDRGWIHRKMPFHHHLGEISTAKRITEVPTDAKNDHFIGKVSPSKQRWPISGHGLLRYQRCPATLQQSRPNPRCRKGTAWAVNLFSGKCCNAHRQWRRTGRNRSGPEDVLASQLVCWVSRTAESSWPSVARLVYLCPSVQKRTSTLGDACFLARAKPPPGAANALNRAKLKLGSHGRSFLSGKSRLCPLRHPP